MQLDTFFVTGGTGNQGGAVARHLASKGFKVKVLTRSPSSNAAEQLKKHRIELVPGDLNNPDTYRQHLKTTTGIFSVQTFVNGTGTEIRQGIDLATLAKENQVQHFIYYSVAGAHLQTGIPHWERKFIIENHIRQLNLPYTILRPASFYENFLIPQVKGRLLKGKLVSPVNNEVVQQFISTDDIGRIAAEIFAGPEKYLGQIMPLAAEQLNQLQIADILSKTMGKTIKFQKLPSIVTRLVMGKNLYKMFSWINGHGGIFIKDMEQIKRSFPHLLGLEQWIALHFKNL